MIYNRFIGLLLTILLLGGCSKSDSDNKKSLDVNKTIPKDAVVSIHNKIYTKKDFPKEYSELKYEGKKRFLSRYIYLRVVLDNLKDKEKIYQKEIKEAIDKNSKELKRRGVLLKGLEKLISDYDITFNTIAYNEVLKKDKNIDKKIKNFYKEHKNAYNYPNIVEISHISFKDKKEATKILKELKDKNITAKIFSQYVEKYSKDLKTISNGGYIGKVSEKELGKDFFNKVFNSKKGNIINSLLEKQNYYHIIYLLDKYPAHKAKLEDEKNNIINFLLRREIRKWKVKEFSKADKNSKVKVYDIRVDI